MAELRFILLIAGLVFLVALAAWELRKPRQASGSDTLRRSARTEPELGSFGDGAPREARRPMTAPPRIELPEIEAIQAESIIAAGDVLDAPLPHVPIDEPAPVLAPEPAAASPAAPPIPEAPAAPTVEVTAEPEAVPNFAVAAAQSAILVPEKPPPPPLLVEWPPDGERHIVSLRIVSPSGERLSGRAVRLALGACGFMHGPYGIYHQPDSRGRALVSIANLSKPGVLDPVNIDFQRLTGLNLFTVLPGALPAAAALDHLLETARELSQRLTGRVQDEHGQPLDRARLEDLRDRVQTLSASGFRAEPAA